MAAYAAANLIVALAIKAITGRDGGNVVAQLEDPGYHTSRLLYRGEDRYIRTVLPQPYYLGAVSAHVFAAIRGISPPRPKGIADDTHLWPDTQEDEGLS